MTHERVRVVASRVGLLVVVLAAWAWASAEGRVSPILLAKPDAVARRLTELLSQATTWAALRLTIMEILAAFAISLIAGLALGFIAGRSEYGTRLLEPVLVWFQTVPIVIIYPVCVLIFGLGPASKIVFAAIYGFFPIAFNTMRGLNTVDRRYVTAARSMGADQRQMLRHILLPAALPMVMSGIRLGAALNMIGVLAGEILASTGGLGYQIAAASQTFRIADVYSFIVIALVLTGVFNAVVTRTEDRRMIP